jgi:hypothetical protein
VEAPGILTDVDDLVIALGGDQQGYGDDHHQQGDAIEIACVERQACETVAKNAAEFETQQYLRPEDQHPGFVEGGWS